MNAVQKLRKVVELDPGDPIAHEFLAVALEAKGLRSESLAQNDLARQSPSGMSFVTGTIAGVYCRQGRQDEARKMLVQLEAAARESYVSSLQLAMIRLALGETDAAFRLLNRAVEERSVNLQYAGVDPVFDSVRRDPRFIAVRNRMGLPEAAWATGLIAK